MHPILFRNDWLKFPTARPHFKTRNKSALELAGKYDMMGIKNNLFFLALLNQDLVDVDPHSPNLTNDQKRAVGIECRVNPWYYFREVCRAPAITGIGSSMIEFNRGNIALWWSFFNHITITLIQPRQTGKSFSTDLLSNGLMGFWCNNTEMNLYTKNGELRAKNIERLKDIYDTLPDYLKLKTKKDPDNTIEIKIGALGNTYKSSVARQAIKDAYKTGRGLTSGFLHGDETPYCDNVEYSIGTALGSMGAVIAEAKKKGTPYGVIFTTTAGKMDSRDGAYVYGMCQESAYWSERFLDTEGPEELEELVRAHSRSRAGSKGVNKRGVCSIYANFSHRQLGKTDEWMLGELERTRIKDDDADRDYFGRWTSGSQSSPIDSKLLDIMNAGLRGADYDYIDSVYNYLIRFYIPGEEIDSYMANNHTVIGVDPSDASGGDDISLIIMSVETGEVIGAGTYNSTNILTLTQWFAKLMQQWKKTTWIIEKRSTGAAILDNLTYYLPQLDIDPFVRLFNWVVNDNMVHKEKYEMAKRPLSRRPDAIYDDCKKQFGFSTSGGGATARSELYGSVLTKSIKRNASSIHDMILGEQMRSLVRKNNRIDHADGKHDDMVIAWLLCNWLLSTGKNLSFYGIDSSHLLTSGSTEAPKTHSEHYSYFEQTQIRTRINELFNLMCEETDPILNDRYEYELSSLESSLVLQEGEVFSLDAFMNNVKKTRELNAMRRY